MHINTPLVSPQTSIDHALSKSGVGSKDFGAIFDRSSATRSTSGSCSAGSRSRDGATSLWSKRHFDNLPGPKRMEMLWRLLLRFLFEYNSAKQLKHTGKTSQPPSACSGGSCRSGLTRRRCACACTSSSRRGPINCRIHHQSQQIISC